MTTSNSQTTVPPSLNHLPPDLSPDSIDTLPILSALLSRLQNPSTSSQSTAGSPPPTAAATSPSLLASGTGPLTIKDIPSATDELKHKLQRARAQIKELPDMERDLGEQEEEIRELEEKIARQRNVLRDLREVGVRAKREREERLRGIFGGLDVMETERGR